MNERKYRLNFNKNDIETKLNLSLICALFLPYIKECDTLLPILQDKIKYYGKSLRSIIYKDFDNLLIIDQNNLIISGNEWLSYKINNAIQFFMDTIYINYKIENQIFSILDNFYFYYRNKDINKDITHRVKKEKYYNFSVSLNILYYENKIKFEDIISGDIYKKIEYSPLYIRKNNYENYEKSFDTIDILINSLIYYIQRNNSNNTRFIKIKSQIKKLINNYCLYFDNKFKYNDDKIQKDWNDLMNNYINIIKNIPITKHKRLFRDSKNESKEYIKSYSYKLSSQNKSNYSHEYFMNKFKEFINDSKIQSDDKLSEKHIINYFEEVRDILKEIIASETYNCDKNKDLENSYFKFLRKIKIIITKPKCSLIIKYYDVKVFIVDLCSVDIPYFIIKGFYIESLKIVNMMKPKELANIIIDNIKSFFIYCIN